MHFSYYSLLLERLFKNIFVEETEQLLLLLLKAIREIGRYHWLKRPSQDFIVTQLFCQFAHFLSIARVKIHQ